MRELDDLLAALAMRPADLDGDTVAHGVLARLGTSERPSQLVSVAVIAVALMIGVMSGQRATPGRSDALALDAGLDLAPSSRLAVPT